MTTRVVFVMVAGLAFAACDVAGGAEDARPSPAPRGAKFFFNRDVMPLVTRLGCSSVQCHGSFWGQGGLSLSLFAGDPEGDYATLVKAARGMRINRLEPAKSALLLKATGVIAHGGGPRIKPDSSEYKTFLAWIEQGSPYGDEGLPGPVAVKVVPQQQVLAKGRTQQVSVTAVFADGTQQEVTRSCAFPVDGREGRFRGRRGQGPGRGFRTCLRAADCFGHSAAVQIVIPQPLSSPFPPVSPNNKIDELVLANLQVLGLPPAALGSDEVFVRRVFLDVIGALPGPEEARAFLADTDPQKRSKLIDRLLDRDEFAAFWALKWSDILRIKAEDPVSLWPKGAEAYYRWVYESIARNKPYDQFARELLTATGSNFRSGPANFFRAVPKREPGDLGASAARIFLGARLECARCHGHPVENWGPSDYLGMAACFSQVQYKFTGEWKEQIVYRDPERKFYHPATGEIVRPKPLGGPVLEVAPGEDPRRKFAEWLTAPENPWFAKTAVNRIWYWLLGRGIVHEPDDFRSNNPPENPELLEYLEKELVGHRYDLKHVFRLVLNSRIYQLSSVPHPLSKNNAAHFSHYQARRLGAESILDALCQVTETAGEAFRDFSRPTLRAANSFPRRHEGGGDLRRQRGVYERCDVWPPWQGHRP